MLGRILAVEFTYLEGLDPSTSSGLIAQLNASLATHGFVAMDRQERRGGLAKALKKLKAAMKLRKSGKKEIAAAAATAEGISRPQSATDAFGERNPSQPVAATAEERHSTETDARPAPVLVSKEKDDELPDSGENTEDEEVLLPMSGYRPGMTDERARALFLRYGLTYQPPDRRHDNEQPPGKIRRVERPVRIRIHWQCHECQSHFARERTCASCGHRRCSACIRSPPKRIMQMVETTRELQQNSETTAPVPGESAQETTTAVAVDSPETSGTVALLPTIASQSPIEPLERDDQADDEEDLDFSRHYRLAMPARPKSGEDLVLRAKSQIIRRQCHKCETPYVPASRMQCESCHHTRCTLCPRFPAKSQKWPMGSPGDLNAPDEEVRMVKAVQRVYKKPRQRIRYTCDRCETVFADSERCRQCGHERCPDCLRNL